MKKCKFCSEEIQETAIKCRYCGEFLEATTSEPAKEKTIEPLSKIQPASFPKLPSRPKKPFRGWLAIFLYGMPLYILTYLSFLRGQESVLRNWDALGHLPFFYRFGLLWMTIGYVGRVFGPSYGLSLSFNRNPWAIKYWQMYFAILSVFSVLEILFFYIGVKAAISLAPSNSAALSNALNLIIREDRSSIAVSLIWFLYWRTSKRVKETFEDSSTEKLNPSISGELGRSPQ